MKLKRAAFLVSVGMVSESVFGVGATTPFVTVEAEAGRLVGGAAVHSFEIGQPVPRVATLELEASGGAYVRLKMTGDGVSIVNPVEGANAFVIRCSIPDTESGGGMDATLGVYVDGVFRQTVTVSSKQSWVYRTPRSGWLDDPKSGGMPFKFYNDDRVRLEGEPLKKGSVVTLKKEEASEAAEYNVDCLDVEKVPEALVRPEGSLSVTEFGAVGDGVKDCQAAIQACVDEARKTGKVVWIPEGKFRISSEVWTGLDISGVTVRGAGMWYTTLYRTPPKDFGGKVWRSYIRVGGGTKLSDVFIDSDSVRRALKTPTGGDYGMLASGTGWVVERVWTQHCDANWMSGTDGVIRDCRVTDGWGDGINLNNGNTLSPDRLGIRLRAENNFVRNVGDDGLATYSDAGEAGNNSQMVGSTFINNTSIAPYWANGMRVAGGKDVVVRGNLVCDVAANNGIDVSTYGKSGHPLESALIEGNVFRRGGGWNGTDRHGLAVGSPAEHYSVVVVRDNVIEESRRAGIYVAPAKIKVVLEGNTVVGPAREGLLVARGVTGAAEMKGNVMQRLREGESAERNQSEPTFVLKKTE